MFTKTQTPVTVDQMPERKRLTSGWVAAVMLTIMMVINWADKSILGLAAGPIMEDLGLTPTQFGTIGSVFFLVFCLTPLVVGFIGNRVSSQWLLAVLVLLWSVAQAPVLLSASFATLMLSRILLGASEGPSASLMHHHLHKWFKPSERAMPGALGSSGSTLGLAVAAPVLTFVIATFSWQAAFAFMALIGLVWLAVWIFVGKDGPLKAYHDAETGVVAPVSEEPTISYWRILATGTWLGGLVGSHFSYWAMTLYATWLPLYLQTALGLELQAVGMIAAIPPIIGFVAFIGSGLIVEVASRKGIGMRWSVGLQIGVTVVVSGIFLLASLATSDPVIKIVLLSLAFGLPNCTLSLVFLSAARITPVRQRAAVFAFTNVGFTTGGIIVPLLVGVLIQQASTPLAGFHQTFLILGIALMIAGVLAGLLINPERDAIRLGLRKGPDSACLTPDPDSAGINEAAENEEVMAK